MKHYLVELTYTAPLEKIDAALEGHRAFLHEGYARGWFLMSGPKNPRAGGVIVARAPSAGDLQALLDRDPFRNQSLADYRLVEFSPVGRAPLLDDWVNG